MKDNLRLFWHRWHLRLLVIVLVAMAITTTTLIVGQVQTKNSVLTAKQQLAEARQKTQAGLLGQFKALVDKTALYKAEGVTTDEVEAQFAAIKAAIFDDDFNQAMSLMTSALTNLESLRNQWLEAERLASEALANQGVLTGTITEDGAPLGSVTVTLTAGSTQAAKDTSSADGRYSLTAAAGKYTLTASKSGYATYRKYNVEITSKTTSTVDISMTKAVSAPSTGSSGGASTANSSYERKTIVSSQGSYLVDIMSFNLGSGGVQVYTDTANDDDCYDNCPAKSLSSYVGGLGGFAGINGTYFCPPDYSTCAGQINSFFWKVKNTRLGKMINANNGLGELDPFLTFSSGGSPTYYSRWSNAPQSVFAGINSKPRLIEGGSYVLNDGDMDDKQRTVKSNRGALAIKGQTLFAVIAKSATVPNLAAVLMALEVDSALNIDGGGSSAMYYKGAYKVGPGRSLPNAVIFVGD